MFGDKNASYEAIENSAKASKKGLWGANLNLEGLVHDRPKNVKIKYINFR